jgi:peptide-methionine (S)-S-oxide reductase
VCRGNTGHAESVEVEFDPKQVSYGELVELFFGLHDPTYGGGGQYRSAIFTHSAEQLTEALAVRDRLQASGKVRGKIATEIVPAGPFWPAEAYHQQFMEKGSGPACAPRSGNTTI